MKFVDRGNNPIDDREWYAMTGALGVGQVLSETTVPHVLGEITIRTAFVGVTGEEPDLGPHVQAARPYVQAVLPYRTMRLIVGRTVWETLQTYREESAARAGHMMWCVRCATQREDA